MSNQLYVENSEFFGQQLHDVKGNAKWDFIK
jgi:hypothetical protein